MQPYDQEHIFRRVMRRTDILRAIVAGILLGLCVIVSAYVSLAAGLWTGLSALILLGAFWSYSHKQRQQPMTDQVTLPALNQAFEQPVYSLSAAIPAEDLSALFPEGARCRCRNQLTAVWHGLSFTFANALVRSQDRRSTLFHGQWLVVHTDWQLPGRVLVREQTEFTQDSAPTASMLPAVDSAFLRAYHVETDAPVKASCILSCRLLQALMLQYPGTRLLAEGATVRLAIPSDQPFFELTGLEESAAQVRSDSDRQIALIQSWLDSLLAVEMPTA